MTVFKICNFLYDISMISGEWVHFQESNCAVLFPHAFFNRGLLLKEKNAPVGANSFL